MSIPADVIEALLGAHARELCSAFRDDGVRCLTPAVIVAKFYTDEGPTYVAVCKTHVLKLSQSIEEIVQVSTGAAGEDQD